MPNEEARDPPSRLSYVEAYVSYDCDASSGDIALAVDDANDDDSIGRADVYIIDSTKVRRL